MVKLFGVVLDYTWLRNEKFTKSQQHMEVTMSEISIENRAVIRAEIDEHISNLLIMAKEHTARISQKTTVLSECFLICLVFSANVTALYAFLCWQELVYLF